MLNSRPGAKHRQILTVSLYLLFILSRPFVLVLFLVFLQHLSNRMMLKVFTLAAVGVVFFASEHAAAAAAGAPELVSFKCDKTEVDVSKGDATVTCKLCANDGSGFYSDSDDMDDTYYSEIWKSAYKDLPGMARAAFVGCTGIDYDGKCERETPIDFALPAAQNASVFGVFGVFGYREGLGMHPIGLDSDGSTSACSSTTFVVDGYKDHFHRGEGAAKYLLGGAFGGVFGAGIENGYGDITWYTTEELEANPNVQTSINVVNKHNIRGSSSEIEKTPPTLGSFKCDKAVVDVSEGDVAVTCTLCATDNSGFTDKNKDDDDEYREVSFEVFGNGEEQQHLFTRGSFGRRQPTFAEQMNLGAVFQAGFGDYGGDSEPRLQLGFLAACVHGVDSRCSKSELTNLGHEHYQVGLDSQKTGVAVCGSSTFVVKGYKGKLDYGTGAGSYSLTKHVDTSDHAANFSLRDGHGNVKTFTPEELESNSFVQTSIDVVNSHYTLGQKGQASEQEMLADYVSANDKTPPELALFKCDKTVVDVSDGDATLSCTLCAKDDGKFSSQIFEIADDDYENFAAHEKYLTRPAFGKAGAAVAGAAFDYDFGGLEGPSEQGESEAGSGSGDSQSIWDSVWDWESLFDWDSNGTPAPTPAPAYVDPQKKTLPEFDSTLNFRRSERKEDDNDDEDDVWSILGSLLDDDDDDDLDDVLPDFVFALDSKSAFRLEGLVCASDSVVIKGYKDKFRLGTEPGTFAIDTESPQTVYVDGSAVVVNDYMLRDAWDNFQVYPKKCLSDYGQTSITIVNSHRTAPKLAAPSKEESPYSCPIKKNNVEIDTLFIKVQSLEKQQNDAQSGADAEDALFEPLFAGAFIAAMTRMGLNAEQVTALKAAMDGLRDDSPIHKLLDAASDEALGDGTTPPTLEALTAAFTSVFTSAEFSTALKGAGGVDADLLAAVNTASENAECTGGACKEEGIVLSGANANAIARGVVGSLFVIGIAVVTGM